MPGFMPSAPGKTTMSVNAGFFQGETGLGVGVAHRLNWSMPTMIYGSYANSGGTGHTGRVTGDFRRWYPAFMPTSEPQDLAA